MDEPRDGVEFGGMLSSGPQGVMVAFLNEPVNMLLCSGMDL